MPSVGQEHGAGLGLCTVNMEKEMPWLGGNADGQERVGKVGGRDLIPVPVQGEDDAAVDAVSESYMMRVRASAFLGDAVSELYGGAVTDELFHRGGPAVSELSGGAVSESYRGGERERAAVMPVSRVLGEAGGGGGAPAGGAWGWGGRELLPCVDRRWCCWLSGVMCICIYHVYL